MTKLFMSVGIGVVAGIIDIIPMVVQKLEKNAIISAFIHWVVLGFIITYVQLPLAGWLKGLIIAEISALPVLALIIRDDSKSIFPIICMSAVLGAMVGAVTSFI